ncbi:hypothetical protein CP533_1927 [Ophiocordyceps camponoti-saundersi (nom. inval.)]|nr:hypothetical protein CP533_1927 [Ophiocordyceps camponoti-saundersi (nom. inval.)]
MLTARQGCALLRCPRALQPTAYRLARYNHSQSTDDTCKLPDASSAQHSDLASFLDYAQRSGLNSQSTVYVGTHYEYTVAESLARLGFSLRRVGGASDLGTDLVGTWALPNFPRPMRVLLQCKAGVARVGPHYVRELEGAYTGAPAGWRGDDVLAVLVCERPATRGIRNSLGRSRWPLAFLCCSRQGHLSQLLWNCRAESEGLEGLGVAVRHADDATTPSQLILTCNGVTLGRVDEGGDVPAAVEEDLSLPG